LQDENFWLTKTLNSSFYHDADANLLEDFLELTFSSDFSFTFKVYELQLLSLPPWFEINGQDM